MSRPVHVTEVLSVLDRGHGRVPGADLRRAARIGTETHRHALGWIRSGFLDFPVPQDIGPYYEAFREWFRDTVAEVFHLHGEPVAEWPFLVRDLNLAGRLDLVARVRGDRAWSLIDLKRVCRVDRVTGLQLAAYRLGVERCMPGRVRIERCFALHIPKDPGPDGRILCRAVEFHDHDNDLRAFLCALTLYRHLGLKGEGEA